MTFHGRLRLFFAIIVIIPMLAIAVVLFSLTADSERGKADAGIGTGLRVAFSLYAQGRAAAQDDVARLARDDALKRALAAGDRGAAGARLRRFVRTDRRVVSAAVSGPDGKRLARAGSSRGVAAFSAFLDPRGGGERLGTLAVSVTDARRLARTASRQTRLEYLILRGGRPVATTVPAVRSMPESGDFDAGGKGFRGRRVRIGPSAGAEEEVGAFDEADDVNSAIGTRRLLIGSIIVAFLLLALATSVFVVRALQGQIGQFLEAARRLGGGRFDQRVQAEGSDEFAQLAEEFNNMSDQLAANIRAVEGQRRELEETIRQIGKAMTTGLDPQASFALTVQTAVRACEAQAGRALPLDLRVLREARAGSSEEALLAALERAERAAVEVTPETGRQLLDPPPTGQLRAGGGGPVSVEHHGVHALALPLRARLATGTAALVGVVSIARRERPFTARERELLEYLGGQAAISIENAALHETVQQQAITDELTGLSNRREMRGALDREMERRRRFETPLGYVALDIDDFKKVNDTYGHAQGDEVLVQVARVLRDLTRDIDEPGRDGGEEFGVVLPQTDLDGAALLAERMRDAIQRLRVPRLGGGDPLGVTASFGVAAVPVNATDMDSLLGAADAALLRAKRGGKNRVERAPEALIRG